MLKLQVSKRYCEGMAGCENRKFDKTKEDCQECQKDYNRAIQIERLIKRIETEKQNVIEIDRLHGTTYEEIKIEIAELRNASRRYGKILLFRLNGKD